MAYKKRAKQDVKKRFIDKVYMEPNCGCWLWTAGLNKWGYGKFHLNGRTRGAHRVSWEIYNGKIPKGLFVLHKCDVRSCVNPQHFWLGTQKDNILDMFKKGRELVMKGEEVKSSKLNEFQVRIIKRLLSFGTMTQKEIGDIFNVNRLIITNINTGTTWKHV